MVNVLSIGIDVAADAIETLIGQIECADGETITVLEVAYRITAAGRIFGYLRNERIDNVEFLVMPDEDHRVVRNLEMTAGDIYSFHGTDLSSAENTMQVLLVYDRKST